MKSTHLIQYTVRGVQPAIDREYRRLARTSGTSFNQTLLDALRRGVDLPVRVEPDNSLDDLFGAMSAKDAETLEQAYRESRALHPKDRI